MIRSMLHCLVIAGAAVSLPLELRAQSWLTHRGTVDAQYDFSCTAPEGEKPVPRTSGPFFFEFAAGEIKSQGGFGKGKIAADGSASGGTGPSFTWWGRFRRDSDGEIRGSGSISPKEGAFGCTGTWSTAAATTPAAVCDGYRDRIERLWSEMDRLMVPYNHQLNELIEKARERLHIANRDLAYFKSGTLMASSLEWLEEQRRAAYALVTQLGAVRHQVDTRYLEMERVRSESTAAGCPEVSLPPMTGGSEGGSKVVDDLLGLEEGSPPNSDIGVAGVRGSVEIETLGSRGSARNGAPIPLSEPVTIRTRSGSSITIQVGGVQQILQPNTITRIVPKNGGPPEITIEQGVSTIDVQKSGARQFQTPVATVGVDGTIFTVSHDAASGLTGVMVEEGRVRVRPKNAALRGVTLAAGEYVQVGPNAISPVLAAPGAPQANPVANPQSNPAAGLPSTPQGGDLTGLWLDDSGGGAVYRVRQVGTRFYWSVDGTSRGSYNNVAFGDISGNSINLKWVDLPGSPTLGGGDLTLRIESNNRLVKTGSTANYPPQAWTRQGSSGGVAPPGRVASDDIAGTWDYAGNVYEITRTATGFAWYLANSNETATITVNASGLSASWRGNSGSGSVTGTIELTSGKPSLIRWSNGAVFKRVGTVGLGLQRAPVPTAETPGGVASEDITGTWEYIGYIYEITRTATGFAWYLARVDERAAITVNGSHASASWRGNSGSGSATGTIELTSGKPSLIRWSNGAIFKKVEK